MPRLPALTAKFVYGICNAFEVEPPAGGDKLRRET
jgi:hypothetical protein